MYQKKTLVLYEYQKTRNSSPPKEFYKDYKEILTTGWLEQYHKIKRELSDLRNANCLTPTKRDYVDAVKALGKSSPKMVRQLVAYQALARISTIYKLEGILR